MVLIYERILETFKIISYLKPNFYFKGLFFLFRFVMRNVANIQALFKMSQEKLATILGNAASAKQLWEFIHTGSKTQEKTQTTLKSKR